MNNSPIRMMIWITTGMILLPGLIFWHGLNPILALVIVSAVVALGLGLLRRMPRLDRGLGGLFLVCVMLYDVGYLAIWQWGLCRREVPAGHSLLLRYKGPFPFGSAPMALEGTLAKSNDNGKAIEIGILEFMPGPGRHFYNPMEYEREIVPDVLIGVNEIGVVTSKIGKNLPVGEILANGPGFRGTWRKVLTPGRYRMNPYAYDVKKESKSAATFATEVMKTSAEDPAIIPPGYVGVVYNKVADDRPESKSTLGVQDKVLQPGLYWVNPAEKRIDIIGVGYNETSVISVREQMSDLEGPTKTSGSIKKIDPPKPTAAKPSDKKPGENLVMEPDPLFNDGQGIEFPSNDGFKIHLDFTAIWGIQPDQAPDIVRNFGSMKDVEQKIITPQIGSICRINGSKRGAVDLLVGDSREEFQSDVESELERVLKAKNLSLLFGLTRFIYVPAEVREPIQRSYIATELKLTREQEQQTAKAQAELTEAEAKVVLEERRTMAETIKMAAETTATGEKKAKEIAAETEKLRAVIDAKTAEVQAQITLIMGAADAKKVQLANEAEAEKYKLAVDALGSPEAYNRYIFAEGLPEEIRLGIFYAGPGTLWTDLKNLDQAFLGKLASESIAPKPAKPVMMPPADQSAGSTAP